MRWLLLLMAGMFACSSSSLSPMSASPSATSCVDAHADAIARHACDTKANAMCSALREVPIDDLDDDGIPDALVAHDELCGATGNCTYHVYVSGSGCAHYAGDVDGVAIRVQPTMHSGVHDVSGYWKGGCVAMEGTGSTWAFDGTMYRVVDQYVCECPYSDLSTDTLDAKRAKNRDARCPGP